MDACWHFLTSLLSLCVPSNDTRNNSGNPNDHNESARKQINHCSISHQSIPTGTDSEKKRGRTASAAVAAGGEEGGRGGATLEVEEDGALGGRTAGD
jgi:hypothetical protein